MTKKIAISVPDDVAERLSADDIDNVSAYITEAVRRRIASERTRNALQAAGFTITEEGLGRWRQRIADLEARQTAEDRAAAWSRTIDRAEETR